MSQLQGTRFPVRLYVVLAFPALMVVVLVLRLLELQWLGRDALVQQGEARSLRYQAIRAPRGMVVDRNGVPLAVSYALIDLEAGRHLWDEPRPLKRDEKRRLERLATLLGHPAEDFIARIEAEGGRARWEELAAVLGEKPGALRRRLEKVGPGQPVQGETYEAFKQRVNKVGTRNAYTLARRLTPEKAEVVLALRIPGIYAKPEYRRYYTAGDMTTQLIGRINREGQGQTGLERAFDQWLSGTQGKRRVLQSRDGRLLEDLGVVQPAKPGKDLQLSIDLRLQTLANQALAQAREQSNAAWAALVLVDVLTGEILALANQPSYNPNDGAAYRAEAARNHALQDRIEPGSTVKPLTMLAALQTGRWHPEDKVSLVDPVTGRRELRIKGRRRPISDVAFGGPSEPNLTEILIESSNIGISKIALDIGAAPIREVMEQLGFGQESVLELPDEQIGRLPSGEQLPESQTTNLAYGYGLEVTLIQLAQAYTTIANDGLKKPLTLFRRNEPVQGEQVIDKDIAKTVRGMLQQVVGASRMPSLARVEGYQVAGKSGTADKNEQGKAGKTRALFAGFAPASAPRFSLVVVLDEPQKISGRRTAHYGGAVAAPVFSQVMEGALRLMQVPPDMPPEPMPDVPVVQLAGGAR